MKLLTKISLTCAALVMCVLPAFSQETKPRQFKTAYQTQMYAEPSDGSSKVTKIPANVILEALEETDCFGGYIKARYKNKTGWVAKFPELERYMDVPAPEPTLCPKGYVIAGHDYRYFFILRNEGALPYVGNLTIRLLDKEGKAVFEETYDWSEGLKPNSGGAMMLETKIEAPRFELEYKERKIRGDTGRFRQRL
jgi:hypothetical protein